MQQNYNEYDEISIKELIQTILKGKYLIMAIVFMVTIATIGGSIYVKNNNEMVKQIISINFDGADSGQNPDGTAFDIDELRSTVVINKAIKELGLNDEISVEDLRKRIDIRPIIPNDIAEIIESRRKSGEEYTYYPSDYIVYFKSYAKLGLSDDDAKVALEVFIDEYAKYFYDTYSENVMLGDAIGSLNYDEYDYWEISSIIHKQIDIIEEYLKVKIIDSKEFRSTTTNMSFADINELATLIKDIDLSRFDSIVKVYKITKDKDALVINYKYTIEQNELEKKKKRSESQVAIDMMKKYDNKTDNLVIPNVSGENLEIKAGQSYYDALAKRATESAVEAENKVHDIDYIEEQIQNLDSDDMTNELKAEAIVKADDILAKITLKIDNLMSLIDKTSNDYFNMKMSNSIMKISPAQVYSKVNVLLNTVIGIVLGLMLGIFIVLFRSYWTKAE